ncbi:MAG: pyridoxal phosphate-dependent aminotransferase [Bacteroidales bacterium]
MSNNVSKPDGSYISYFSNLVKQHGGLNLAQGIPGFQPPEELRSTLKDLTDKNIHQYAPGTGNFDLLNILHQHYSKEFNVDKENFLMVQGATEAISLIYTYLVRKLNGKFSALSFKPAYESYSQLPLIFGQPFVHYPLNENFSFCKEEVKKTIISNNVKVVFISSPGNPYGKIWSEQEINTLVQLSHELDFYIIFDAVYKELFFNVQPYMPLNHKSPNLFYVNSFSKTLCITGWRVGYLYAHKSHRNQLRSIHDYIGLCAPSILQEAIARYLGGSNFGHDFIKDYRQEVKRSFEGLSLTLSKLGFSIPPINGGCFIWAKLPESFTDGFEFAHDLYNTKRVAVIPGEHFSRTHTNWIRLNIARPFKDISEAGELIAQFVSNA